MHLHFEHSDLICHIFLTSADKLDLVTRLDRTVHDLKVCDDSTERVEYRVKDQRLKRSIRISLRRRDTLYNSVKHFFYTLTCLTGSKEDILRLATEKIHDLICNNLNHCRLNIDLVKYRNDLKVMLNREIKIRNGLSLNTLCRIHNKERALARSDSS